MLVHFLNPDERCRFFTHETLARSVDSVDLPLRDRIPREEKH